jgi:hypothetical protein
MGGMIPPIAAFGGGGSSVTYQDTSNDTSGDSSSGWMSGLGDLFAGIGAGVGAGIAGSNLPRTPVAGSGWQYNPATGTYVNPITGQALTATGTIPSIGGLGATLSGNNTIMIVVIAVVAYLLLRKS